MIGSGSEMMMKRPEVLVFGFPFRGLLQWGVGSWGSVTFVNRDVTFPKGPMRKNT